MPDKIIDSPQNLVFGNQPKEFWVWVDPDEFMTNHNMNLIGSFCSTPIATSSDALMFLPNPKFQGFISPFQNNLVWNYIAEFNLENRRLSKFSSYPSRLAAIFLIESEEEAKRYESQNPDHVKNRKRVRGITNGPYLFSRHDSAWINFLRKKHGMSPQDIEQFADSYWKGESLESYSMISHGKKWTQPHTNEVLFLGRLDFEKTKA